MGQQNTFNEIVKTILNNSPKDLVDAQRFCSVKWMGRLCKSLPNWKSSVQSVLLLSSPKQKLCFWSLVTDLFTTHSHFPTMYGLHAVTISSIFKPFKWKYIDRKWKRFRLWRRVCVNRQHIDVSKSESRWCTRSVRESTWQSRRQKPWCYFALCCSYCLLPFAIDKSPIRCCERLTEVYSSVWNIFIEPMLKPSPIPSSCCSYNSSAAPYEVSNLFSKFISPLIDSMPWNISVTT